MNMYLIFKLIEVNKMLLNVTRMLSKTNLEIFFLLRPAFEMLVGRKTN